MTTCTHWTDLNRRDGGHCTSRKCTVSWGVCQTCKLRIPSNSPEAPDLDQLKYDRLTHPQPTATAPRRISGCCDNARNY